jgi:hypothetical protein
MEKVRSDSNVNRMKMLKNLTGYTGRSGVAKSIVKEERSKMVLREVEKRRMTEFVKGEEEGWSL